jgi:hypothetical protein
MATEKSYEHWTKGLASLLWPVLAFVMLCAFWTELHNIADRIPNVIDRSKSINIASVKIELDAALQMREPSPPVAKALQELYAEDLKLMLNSPDVPQFARAERLGEYREKYAHLMQLGLVVESESTMWVGTVPGPEDLRGHTFKYTPPGAEAKAYLIDVIVRLFSGAKRFEETRK